MAEYIEYTGSKDEIACQYSRRTYAQTSIVCCFIHAGRLSKETRDPELGRCYVQACGHIFVDQKWAKLTGNVQDLYLQKTPGLHQFHENIKAPLLAKQPSSSSVHTSCLLVTQQQPVPLEALLEKGFFVQVELPADMLPSCKGLTAKIVYNVNVVIERTDLSKPKVFSFPFAVCSNGCATSPYELKYAHLDLFPAAYLTREDRMLSVLEHSGPPDSEDKETFLITKTNNISSNKIMYGDECIGLFRYSARIYVATHVNMYFDLDETTKFFDVMRVRFVQTEHKSNGESVQEKVMSSTVRHCRHALRLNALLPLPPQYCTTFVGPTMEFRYHLEVDFFEQVTDEKPDAEHLSWNFPVDVVQNPPCRSIKGEMLACVQSSVCLDHYAI